MGSFVPRRHLDRDVWNSAVLVRALLVGSFVPKRHLVRDVWNSAGGLVRVLLVGSFVPRRHLVGGVWISAVLVRTMLLGSFVPRWTGLDGFKNNSNKTLSSLLLSVIFYLHFRNIEITYTHAFLGHIKPGKVYPGIGVGPVGSFTVQKFPASPVKYKF